MPKGKNKKQREPIPESFASIEEAADWWDQHSLADYWDQTHEVEFEVNLVVPMMTLPSSDHWKCRDHFCCRG